MDVTWFTLVSLLSLAHDDGSAYNVHSVRWSVRRIQQQQQQQRKQLFRWRCCEKSCGETRRDETEGNRRELKAKRMGLLALNGTHILLCMKFNWISPLKTKIALTWLYVQKCIATKMPFSITDCSGSLSLCVCVLCTFATKHIVWASGRERSPREIAR